MSDLSLTIRHEARRLRSHREAARARFRPGAFRPYSLPPARGWAARENLSFAALVGTLMVGSIRLDAHLAGGAPALLLGPVTVEPAFENHGIGMALVRRRSRRPSEGHALVLLVGDEPFNHRAGFHKVPRGQPDMPGPVDPAAYCRWSSCRAYGGAQGPATRRFSACRHLLNRRYCPDKLIHPADRSGFLFQHIPISANRIPLAG